MLRIDTSAFKLEEVFSLRHKRPFENYLDMQEKIKYMVIEGGSITLLGLVKYNPGLDEFNMTELTAVLGGGITEAKRQLEERLATYQENLSTCVIFGLGFLGIALFLHRMRC